MIDLTTGNPIKQMIKFALPVCLGNIFQLFYSLADTRIVGSTLGESSLASVGATTSIQLFYSLADTRIVGSTLGESSLASVGATTSISTLLIGFLSGMTNGFSIVVAQQFGEKNEKKIKKTVAGSLFLGLVISIIISIISISFLDEILKILNISEELYQNSTLYIKIRGVIPKFNSLYKSYTFGDYGHNVL